MEGPMAGKPAQKLQYLPQELRALVRKMTDLLGEVICEQEGKAFYARIESHRRSLKNMRQGTGARQLNTLLKKLSTGSASENLKTAHAFALLLELTNVAETAYRTWRQVPPPAGAATSSMDLYFVLTAHPTEARSQVVVEALDNLTQLLVTGLHSNFSFNQEELLSHLRLLWLYPLAKSQAPTVLDEAEYIDSLVFSKEVFDSILQNNDSYNLKLHTWVGGDKDGHTGVNATVMRDCLQRSRQYLLRTLLEKLALVEVDLQKLAVVQKKYAGQGKKLNVLILKAQKLEKLSSGDGPRLQRWTLAYRKFKAQSGDFIQKHHQIVLLDRLLELFPALVLPIELREDSSEIRKALTQKKAPIRQMLEELKKIAAGHTIRDYAKSLVISHCEEAQDLSHAQDLTELVLKNKKMPIIPLFESREALQRATRILTLWLSDPKRLSAVRGEWKSRFEIMVGYSDSSKQVGVLPSRLLVREVLQDLEKLFKKWKLQPVFFHGSGGSVIRGGGSLKEQIAWWPDSAVQTPKLTVQGEMIQRTFATKEILSSQCRHLSDEAKKRKKQKLRWQRNLLLDRFAEDIESSYTSLMQDGDLLERLLKGSPYHYLQYLKIGSRPTKRPSGAVDLSSLRAIPWVLCWTQNRSLIPAWWGVGTAWAHLSVAEKKGLRDLYKKDPFVSSFVKTLGYTVAKVELDIWKTYLRHQVETETESTIALIEKEFALVLKFLRELTGEKKLIWFRPWLEESIELRSAYIHILNLLQVIAMKKKQEPLLRETLVGIACGMMTTG